MSDLLRYANALRERGLLSVPYETALHQLESRHVASASDALKCFTVMTQSEKILAMGLWGFTRHSAATDLLITTLRHQLFPVVSAAASALSQIGGEKVVRAAIDKIRDCKCHDDVRSIYIQVVAGAAIPSNMWKEVSSVLLGVASNTTNTSTLRSNAIECIRFTMDESASTGPLFRQVVSELLTLSNDGSPCVRASSISTICSLQVAESKEVLIKALADHGEFSANPKLRVCDLAIDLLKSFEE